MTPLGPLVLVTGSSDEPVSRTEAKTWLRIEEEEVHEDALVDQLIAMARARYEEYTGRALLKQTWDYYLDEGFPPEAQGVELPRWPLVSITSVTGFSDTDATDTGGTAMNSSEYYVDTAREPGRVVPFGAYSFPSATRVANAAIVRFVAGETSQTSGVPSYAKQTIKQMIAHAYEHRGDQDVSELEPLMDEVLNDARAIRSWG